MIKINFNELNCKQEAIITILIIIIIINQNVNQIKMIFKQIFFYNEK